MNNSGSAVLCAKEYRKTQLKDIVVIYDDVDLPLGKIKISYDRSSGGHNGLESIIKKLKSREFVRIRIGISASTPSGKIRKPKGEKDVLKFLLGEFKEKELLEIKKISKKVIFLCVFACPTASRRRGISPLKLHQFHHRRRPTGGYPYEIDARFQIFAVESQMIFA